MKMLKSALCICVSISVLAVFAMTALCFASPVDTAHLSSLTVEYKHNEERFDGLEIKIYRIAEAHEDATFSLFGDFKEYPVNIYGITSQTEWKSLTSTLAAYVAADSIAPTATLLTDENGVAAFTDILPGIYLVGAVTEETETGVVKFENFMSVIPRTLEDDSHEYDVTAIPKYEFIPFEAKDIEYKVVKLWRDEGKTEIRPVSVEVEILKNGETFTTVQLSSENNWTYSWTAKDDGSIWNAVERNVAEDYTVTVESDGVSFVITNTYEYEETPPQTGDTMNFFPYIVAMSISGVMLIIIGVWYSRKPREAGSTHK